MNVTIYDIAKKVGISTATVSRALNEKTKHKVAIKTLKKIEHIVKKLQYTPNITARHLRTKYFYTIGIILPHFKGLFHNDYYADLLSGVSDALLGTNYNFKTIILKKIKDCVGCDACSLVCPVETIAERGNWDTYNFRIGEGVDGLIVTHWPMFFSKKTFPDKAGIPYVIINDPDEDIKVHSVCCDDYKGGEIAAGYLLTKGHKDIAVLAGPQWSEGSRLRLKGFKDTLLRLGISIDDKSILSANYQEEQAFNLVEKLLSGNKNITAIFCLNDEMAVGVLRKLGELNISCPKEISVMGFDDRKGIAQGKYKLTTIHQPVEEIARDAVSILLSDISMDYIRDGVYKRKKMPVYLVERETVRKI